MTKKWNDHEYEKLAIKKRYKILKPKIVCKGKMSRGTREEYISVEDYLPGKFISWNSNSGWINKVNQESSVQAFCHWTYHYSNGKILFCDAQGIITKKEYILTDPCVMSVEGNRYGAGDCGYDYILNWFKYHKCNKYCQKHWITPNGNIDIKQEINVTQHTTWIWQTQAFKISKDKKKIQEKGIDKEKDKEKEKEKEIRIKIEPNLISNVKSCKCKSVLVAQAAKDVFFGLGICCERCDVKVDGTNIVYHCPNEQNNVHPHGYDLCYDCYKSL